jgi:hypothetical protein
MADELALVFYGRGDTLGNFKFFADDLVTTELSAFDKKNIIIKNVERRDDFFNYLNTTAFAAKIKEFHIYSHSYGGALSLGYGDPIILNSRSNIVDRAKGGTANYLSVLNNEVGSIFTDDLIRSPYLGYRQKIRDLFAVGSKIKIWGCNSGIADWLFSDNLGNTRVYDVNAAADSYYWRAINEQNTPKPSVAQAFANYFQVTTFGATSGSSIQVQHNGAWMPSPAFLKQSKRKFVKESDTLRLAPDQGVYNEYKPQ